MRLETTKVSFMVFELAALFLFLSRSQCLPAGDGDVKTTEVEVEVETGRATDTKHLLQKRASTVKCPDFNIKNLRMQGFDIGFYPMGYHKLEEVCVGPSAFQATPLPSLSGLCGCTSGQAPTVECSTKVPTNFELYNLWRHYSEPCSSLCTCAEQSTPWLASQPSENVRIVLSSASKLAHPSSNVPPARFSSPRKPARKRPASDVSHKPTAKRPEPPAAALPLPEPADLGTIFPDETDAGLDDLLSMLLDDVPSTEAQPALGVGQGSADSPLDPPQQPSPNQGSPVGTSDGAAFSTSGPGPGSLGSSGPNQGLHGSIPQPPPQPQPNTKAPGFNKPYYTAADCQIFMRANTELEQALQLYKYAKAKYDSAMNNDIQKLHAYYDSVRVSLHEALKGLPPSRRPPTEIELKQLMRIAEHCNKAADIPSKDPS
ncbi:MAG: hypothetical protein M1833_002112 [Piccolia ochrophora]|nr:MAG: hypothetical protein M1833_002112 [Piccolia ochrophora]